LHLIQPIARFRGRIRGLASLPLPQSVAPQHVTPHPWSTPALSFRDAYTFGHLFSTRGSERTFWSESPVSRADLLAELAGVLRASRPAHLVRVDDGWRSDRDLSLAIGRWGWLHVQALIEEHDRGRCLFRARARLRPSFIGTVQGLALAILLVGGAGAATALYRPSVSVAVLVTTVAVIAGRTAWQATRAAAALRRALGRVTSDAGMLPLPMPPALAPRASRPVETAGARG